MGLHGHGARRGAAFIPSTQLHVGRTISHKITNLHSTQSQTPRSVPPLDMSKVAAQLALQARDASDASPRGRGGRNWPPKGGLAPTVLSARSSQREAEFCLEVDFDMSTLPPVQETGHLDQYAQVRGRGGIG